MKIQIISLFILFLAACSSPQKDNRTLVENFNGENYNATDTVMSVPVLYKKPMERKFSGHVYCSEGISKVSTNHATITIFKGSEKVTSSTSNMDGSFNFSSLIEPSGNYKMQASAPCGIASRDLEKGDLKGASNLEFYLKM